MCFCAVGKIEMLDANLKLPLPTTHIKAWHKPSPHDLKSRTLLSRDNRMRESSRDMRQVNGFVDKSTVPFQKYCPHLNALEFFRSPVLNHTLAWSALHVLKISRRIFRARRFFLNMEGILPFVGISCWRSSDVALAITSPWKSNHEGTTLTILATRG